MLRRYELTNDEWNRTILNGIVWITHSGVPWRDLPERYESWQTVYSCFRKWIEDGILDNISCLKLRS